MEFGKLSNVDSVDWKIPEDSQVSLRFLERFKNQTTPALDIRFGAPAWGSKSWVGKIYPPKTKPADFLIWYAKYFSTIELNTTHYRIPSAEQVARWRAQAGPGFTFCPKIYQGISHERFGLADRDLLRGWLSFLDQLGEAGGPSFLQLPPHFDYSMKAELFTFLKSWPASHKLALEFRHPSWFEGSTILRPLTEYLQQRGIGLVITDVAGRRDVLHTSLSADFSLLRFIGCDLHPSDAERAEAWAERFKAWEAAGLSTLYLFIHEPDDIATPEMTEIFLETLAKVGNWHLRRGSLGSQASLPPAAGAQVSFL